MMRAPFFQVRKHRFHHMEHGKYVGAECFLELRLIDTENTFLNMLLRRVIHEYLDMLKGGKRFFHYFRTEFFVSHITCD